MRGQLVSKGSLSVKITRADGTVEDRGMIFSTSRIDRVRMWIKKLVGI